MENNHPQSEDILIISLKFLIARNKKFDEWISNWDIDFTAQQVLTLPKFHASDWK